MTPRIYPEFRVGMARDGHSTMPCTRYLYHLFFFLFCGVCGNTSQIALQLTMPLLADLYWQSELPYQSEPKFG